MTDGTTSPAAGPSAVVDPAFGDGWWRDGIIYQIYPRSFADSDGDGVGDLPGIVARLDELEELGVDAIWLSPIYPSPGLDVGYDVSDHASVDPVFGGDAAFDHFVDEAHKRGIRVILDLVMNHTSDQHAVVPGQPCVTRQPLCRLVPVAGPIRHRRRGTSLAAEQLAVVVRRLGVAVGRVAAAVLHAHVPRRAARAELAQPGCRASAVRHGPGLARPRRRRLPARRLQRLPQAPRAAGQSRDRGAHAVGPPAAPVRPRPTRLPGPHRPVPGDPRRAAGPDVGRRAVRERGRTGRRRSPPSGTWCSTGPCSPRRGRPRRTGRRSGCASRCSVQSAGSRTSCRTTTSRARPAAWPPRRASPTPTPSRRPRRWSC